MRIETSLWSHSLITNRSFAIFLNLGPFSNYVAADRSPATSMMEISFIVEQTSSASYVTTKTKERKKNKRKVKKTPDRRLLHMLIVHFRSCAFSGESLLYVLYPS